MAIEQDGRPSGFIPGRAPETSKLVEFMRGEPEGTLYSYEELGEVIGRNVAPHGIGYGYLQSALHILSREHGEWWGNIPKVGYKRLDPSEQLALGKSYTKRAKRRLKRSEMALVNGMDYERLTPDEKRDRDGYLWTTRVMQLFGRKDSINKIGHEAGQALASKTEPNRDFVTRVIGLFGVKKDAI